MFIIQKLIAGAWKEMHQATTLRGAVEWCLDHQNLRDGRILDCGGAIVYEDIQQIEMQGVCDQWGFVGYQCK
jgi:hypothetical protein